MTEPAAKRPWEVAPTSDAEARDAADHAALKRLCGLMHAIVFTILFELIALVAATQAGRWLGWLS